jgi:phosphoribosylformylglycinamidine synthase
VTALDIMTDGPLGGAAFNNEFGRPALNGYFRTYEEKVTSHNGEELRGTTNRSCWRAVLVTFAASTCRKAKLPLGRN